MRKTFFIVSVLLCTTGISYAQDSGKPVKRTVEMNRKLDTKSSYNYFLLDMVRDADIVYTDYEKLVQRVWDKEINLDLNKSSKEPLEKLEKIKDLIKDIPVFRGGNEYQESVLAYIDIVKKKVEYLELYGILGADENSDIVEYNNVAIAFNEITNVAIDSRNEVRRKKGEYEKTVYMNK